MIIEPKNNPTNLAGNSGQKTVYQNKLPSISDRVEELLALMTLEEKIGQMTLPEKNVIPADDVQRLGIGAVLSGGGGYPTGDNSPSGWLGMINGYQEAALKSRLGIPILYGVDAVHGHSNLYGATIFPHNVGLGATRDADLVQRNCLAIWLFGFQYIIGIRTGLGQ